MKDCIYRKEATKFIDKCLNHEEKLQSVERETLIAVKKYLESVPTADVVEVRHGRWSMTKDGAAYCSACKRKMNPYLYGYAHCAMCGAKMDGGVNDAAD